MRATGAARSRGVTLIELMIVIVLLAIVIGFAVPSYRNYVLRSHRADAASALLRARTAQEKFFLDRDRYMIDAELAARGLAASENAFYVITTAVDPTAPAGTPSFIVTATAQGGQLDDDACQSFIINDRGQRQALDATSADNTNECWR